MGKTLLLGANMKKKEEEFVLVIEDNDKNADWIKHVSKTSYEDELQICREAYGISEEDLPGLDLDIN